MMKIINLTEEELLNISAGGSFDDFISWIFENYGEFSNFHARKCQEIGGRFCQPI